MYGYPNGCSIGCDGALSLPLEGLEGLRSCRRSGGMHSASAWPSEISFAQLPSIWRGIR